MPLTTRNVFLVAGDKQKKASENGTKQQDRNKTNKPNNQTKTKQQTKGQGKKPTKHRATKPKERTTKTHKAENTCPKRTRE